MISADIDDDGRCRLCRRDVPDECPEPDGLQCAEYVRRSRKPTVVVDPLQRLVLGQNAERQLAAAEPVRLAEMAPQTLDERLGARGCEADEHGPEDGRF